MKNTQTRMFIEVKEVTGTDDLSDYITSSKLRALRKSIEAFLLHYGDRDLEQCIVVVYTK